MAPKTVFRAACLLLLGCSLLGVTAAAAEGVAGPEEKVTTDDVLKLLAALKRGMAGYDAPVASGGDTATPAPPAPKAEPAPGPTPEDAEERPAVTKDVERTPTTPPPPPPPVTKMIEESSVEDVIATDTSSDRSGSSSTDGGASSSGNEEAGGKAEEDSVSVPDEELVDPIIPVEPGRKNYNPDFEWAQTGEAWSVGLTEQEVAKLKQEPRNMVRAARLM